MALHALVLQVRLEFCRSCAPTIVHKIFERSRVITHYGAVVDADLALLKTVRVGMGHHLGGTTSETSRGWLFTVFAL